MYEHFYGFKAKPFKESFDSDAFYLGESQKRALISIHDGLKNGGGFIVVTGLSGTGKTSLVEFLKKEQINSSLDIAGISGKAIDDHNLLPAILSSFNCPVTDHKLPALIAQIEAFIHSQIDVGKKPILVVDEAHNLSFRSLEVLRLLSNFQSHGRPSFQVILVGDIELGNMLQDQNHSSLKEQIVSSTEMIPMELDDTKNYVMHHLKRVGWLNKPALTDDVFEKAQRETTGIPAEVNQYFDRLLQREMMKTSELASPVSDVSAKSRIDSLSKELDKEELLAALSELDVAGKKPLANDSVSATSNHQSTSHTEDDFDSKFGFSGDFDDGMTLEETKRAFEGGSGGAKSTNGWFDWKLVGVVVGSYLLSAVIAASFYYTEVSVTEAVDNAVIMADIGEPPV